MELSQAKVIVNVVDVTPCEKKLQLEMPAERADAIYQKVMKNVAAHATLPGFRAGKVPAAMLMKNFGSRIEGEAIDEIVQAAYSEALELGGLRGKIIASPRLEGQLSAYKKGEAYKLEVAVTIAPEVPLPEYKGLELTRETAKIEDADVEKQLDNFADMSVSYEEEAKPAEADDMLQLSYEAKLPEGMEVSDRSHYLVKAENTWLALREPEMLPGASEQLKGISAGEERDVTITFPEDFAGSDELKGKSLQYHFAVKSVRAQKRPPLDDDFATRFGLESLEQMKTLLRERLEERAKNEARNKLDEAIMNKLVEGQNFALPKNLVDSFVAEILAAKLNAKRREGLTEEQLKEQGEALKAEAIAEAEISFRKTYILDEIAKAENIELGKDDLGQIMMSFRSQENAKANPIQLFKEKQKSGEFQRACSDLRVRRTLDKIIELAKITDVEAAK